MAKRTPPPAPELRPANIPPAGIPEAIRKLERRLKNLEDADLVTLAGTNLGPQAESVSNTLNSTLIEVFGQNTIELARTQMKASDFLMTWYHEDTSQGEHLDAFKRGIELAKTRLQSEIFLLRERIEDADGPSAFSPWRAYEGLDLHPEISAAAADLFRDGHYANAIVDSVKALNALVRYKSGLELDGSNLMEVAFSPKNPVLRFNDMADQSDLDEQKGFMFMFSGAVAGLRNPRAHKLIKDDPERALEFIAFVSLLAKLVSSAKKA